jgi:N-acyl-D-aspartate/D-glutamate deacylase
MTVLRDALLVDGTGMPPRPADVVIEGDRIAAFVTQRLTSCPSMRTWLRVR